MKILRSVIPDTRVGDDPLQMQVNYSVLRDSIYVFDTKEDNEIWDYVKTFMANHGHLPDQDTLVKNFEAKTELEVADRVRVLTAVKPVYKGDFVSELELQVESVRVRRLLQVMNEAKDIVRSGIEIKEKGKKRVLKGPRDASRYLSNSLVDILTPTFGSRIGGEAMSDIGDLKDQYQKAQASGKEILPISGLKPIDDALGGFRKKELYLLAGFTGHMKSKSALNFVYNQAVMSVVNTNTLYFSLEMHYDQCRRAIHTIHSMHPKFRPQRIALGLQDPTSPVDFGIDPVKLRNGCLTPEEYTFYFDYVLPDLEEGKNKGTYGSIHFEGDNPDSFDFTVEDLKAKAEIYAQKEKIDLIVVDHALLLASRNKYSSTTEKLNEVIRDLKRMAMNFNRGQGIPVLCLFQISREGYTHALKNKGEYHLTHLSYANEAERSADVVIANWFGDDMRSQNCIQYQCLKSRDQAPFQTFQSNIAFPTGKIYSPSSLPIMSINKRTGNQLADDPLSDVL
jgi:hypothetical protein